MAAFTVTTPPTQPMFAQPQPQATVQFQPTLAGPSTSTVVAAPPSKKRGLPNWDVSIAAKLKASDQYKKIERSDSGFKSGTLQVSGAKSMMEKMAKAGVNFIYLPSLRLAGEAQTLADYLSALAAANKISAQDAQAAMNGAYTYDNAVVGTNAGLEQELAAKAAKPKAAKEVKSAMTLQQLIDLKKAMGRTRGKAAPTGARAGKSARQAKSPLDRIAEARGFNQGVVPGQAYKYLYFTIGKDGVEKTFLKVPGTKSVKVLPLEFPLSASNASLLKSKLDQFRATMGDALYQKGLQELAAQQ